MPYLTIEYTDALADTLDRPALAHALHPVVAETAGAATDNCKTRFRRAEEYVIGTEGPVAWLHVEVALLAGRSEDVRGRLARAVLEEVRARVPAPDGFALHTSVEVREMVRESYAAHREPAAVTA